MKYHLEVHVNGFVIDYRELHEPIQDRLEKFDRYLADTIPKSKLNQQPNQEASAEKILQNRASLSDYEMHANPNEKLVTVPECLEAMHEFASLREVKMPDRGEYITFLNSLNLGKATKEKAIFGFDYYESELKRLNNLK